MNHSIIMSSARRLRFMSWNSNGLKSKILKVKTEIQKQNCDVVFLQETHLGTGKIFEKLKDYKSLYTTQTSTRTGVAILIKKEIYEETSCTIERDHAGCYILVKCTLNGQLFTLMSVYNCHTDIKPLLTLRSVLEKHAEDILLIGGDFNLALNPYLDRTSTKRNKTHSLLRPIVKELMTSFKLVDVWRRFHPTDRQYSYQQKHVESRLDYIFVPEESMRYIETCEISRYKSCSDHYPVVFEVTLSGDESKKLELFPNIIKEEDTKDVLRFQQSVIDKWLSSKRKYWPNIDLPVNFQTSLMISVSVSEVEQAIQSLNHTESPDDFQAHESESSDTPPIMARRFLFHLSSLVHLFHLSRLVHLFHLSHLVHLFHLSHLVYQSHLHFLFLFPELPVESEMVTPEFPVSCRSANIVTPKLHRLFALPKMPDSELLALFKMANPELSAYFKMADHELYELFAWPRWTFMSRAPTALPLFPMSPVPVPTMAEAPLSNFFFGGVVSGRMEEAEDTKDEAEVSNLRRLPHDPGPRLPHNSGPCLPHDPGPHLPRDHGPSLPHDPGPSEPHYPGPSVLHGPGLPRF
nr:uncharacterized protein LOC129454616 [Misgurnus anguillicaudatus]